MMGPNGIQGPGQGLPPDLLNKVAGPGSSPSGASGADRARAFMDDFRSQAAGPAEATPGTVEVQPVAETRPPVATVEVTAVDPPRQCAEVEMSIQRMLEPGPVRDGINGRMHGLKEGWNQLEQARTELSEAVRDGRLDQMSPEYGRIRENMGMATLRLQVRAQEAHFGVELLSKLVENATGGVRTILQTQA